MVEWDGLENRCARKGTEGSNPSLSAMLTWRLTRLAGPPFVGLLPEVLHCAFYE